MEPTKHLLRFVVVASMTLGSCFDFEEPVLIRDRATGGSGGTSAGASEPVAGGVAGTSSVGGAGASVVTAGDGGSVGDSGSAGTAGSAGSAGSTGPVECGGSAPFPSLGVIDDFNREDGPLGAPWEIAATFDVVDGELHAGPFLGVAHTAEEYGENQEAYVTLVDFDPELYMLSLLLKVQIAGDPCEVVAVTYSHYQHQLLIEYCEAGSPVVANSTVMTLAPGQRLGARVFASGCVEAFVDGERTLTADVSQPTTDPPRDPFSWIQATGRLGIWYQNKQDSSEGSPPELDNFGGGTLLGSP